MSTKERAGEILNRQNVGRAATVVLISVSGHVGSIAQGTSENNPDTGQQNAQVNEVPATIIPFQSVNVRPTPSVDHNEIGTTVIGQNYLVLATSQETDGTWFLIDYNDAHGWVRSDVVPPPEGATVPDITAIANIPLATPGATEGQLIPSSGVDLMYVKSAFDYLQSLGAPSETFLPENIELIQFDDQGLFFKLRQTVTPNEVGTVVRIFSTLDKNIAAMFGPAQYSQVLADSGISTSPNAEFVPVPGQAGFVHFGDNILFDMNSAALEIEDGEPPEVSLPENTIAAEDTVFPEGEVTFRFNDDMSEMTFDDGSVFQLYVEGNIIRARLVLGEEYAVALSRLSEELLQRLDLAVNDPNRLIWNASYGAVTTSRGEIVRPELDRRGVEERYLTVQMARQRFELTDRNGNPFSMTIALERLSGYGIGQVQYRQAEITALSDSLQDFAQRYLVRDYFNNRSIHISLTPFYRGSANDSLRRLETSRSYMVEIPTGYAYGLHTVGNHIFARARDVSYFRDYSASELPFAAEYDVTGHLAFILICLSINQDRELQGLEPMSPYDISYRYQSEVTRRWLAIQPSIPGRVSYQNSTRLFRLFDPMSAPQ